MPRKDCTRLYKVESRNSLLSIVLILMKRPYPPEAIMSRKRLHLNEGAQEHFDTHLPSPLEVMPRSSHYVFGRDQTKPEAFHFRYTMPRGDGNEGLLPSFRLPAAINDLMEVQLHFATQWHFDFKGPREAMNAVINALPFMTKTLMRGK